MYFSVCFQALILIGRAVNIFPLSLIANYFREHKITRKQQFIMWFSGKNVFIVLQCKFLRGQ